MPRAKTRSTAAAVAGGASEAISLERIIEDWRAQRPDVDTTPMRLHARVARIEAMKRPFLRAIFARHDLSSGLFDALAALRRVGPPYRDTPTALAKATMLTTGGITGRLDSLEAAGLIEREASREDRRVTYAKLTEKGLALVDGVLDELVAAEARLLGGLSAAQVERLARDLRAFEESVRAATGGHMEAAG